MQLLIPKYDGLESEYEDIIYTFFRDLSKIHNFYFRPKKSRTKLDKYMVSMNGNEGFGKADGYILANIDTDIDFFSGILELESSNVNIQEGIKQNIVYIQGIRNNWNEIFRDRRYFLNIVYNGKCIFLQKIYESHEETIIDKKNIDSLNHEIITDTLIKEIDSISSKNKISNIDEKTLMKQFKKLINNRQKLKKYRSELMTVLASIYDITYNKNFNDALDVLVYDTSELGQKIHQSWNSISKKIDYIQYKETIRKIYTEIAIPMYQISLDRNIDLYGFFYEELAEKDTKKENGEYYTPRHIIGPILRSVFNNYLKNDWLKYDLVDKKILDPFCGSGGFLYEYTRFIKEIYNLSKEDLNEIAQESIYGFDIIDTSAARLNMYLVGDGELNLSTVKTSIGWRERYTREAKNTIEESLNLNIDSMSKLLKVYLNNKELNFLRDNKYLTSEFKLTKKAIKIICEKDNDGRLKFKNIDEAICVMLNRTSDYINFGDTDLLITNIPYGDMSNIDKSLNSYTDLNSKNETNALKDCIDFLRHKKIDARGKIIDEGGIGIIIIPSGIIETPENRAIREYVIKRCEILSVIKLPKYTFAPYAAVQTYVLTIRKRSIEEINEILKKSNYHELLNNDNVFMYISDRDGKAASDKRFMIRRTEEVEGYGVEFIHDDFAKNYGKYNGDYKSKLERCWNYKFWNYNKAYNQKRITEEWDGNNWGIIPGNKWGFFDLKFKEIIISKKNTIPKEYIKNIKKYCKHKRICIARFFRELREEEIDFNYKIKKSYILIKSQPLLMNNKDTIYYDSIEKEWIYIKEEKYKEFILAPEVYIEGQIDNYFVPSRIKEWENIKYNIIKISDYFISYGEDSNITEEYIYNNIGPYPVYSGQTECDGIIGYINKCKFNGEFLTWTTYGSAGKVFYRNGKFNIGRNCAGLKLKDEYKNIINLKYFRYVLEKQIEINKISRDSRGNVSIQTILPMTLMIPEKRYQDNYINKYHNLDLNNFVD